MSTTATEKRLFNFSAGPATMPASVLEEIRDELLCYPGAGASIMEISHRSKTFVDVMESAKSDLRSLMAIPDDYDVLLLQGGSALQFSMVPANLLRGTGKTAHYLVTGSWSKKAIAEAKKEGDIVNAYDASASNFNHVPGPEDFSVPDDSAMLYYCGNETIQGVQFHTEPNCPSAVPLACDVSSEFLCRPTDVSKYGLLYACAQKNAGPAGVTAVIIRKDLLERSQDSLPGYLNYRNHSNADSMWNTPPTFAVYAFGKIIRWLADEMGGLESIGQLNQQKAKLLYDVIDAHSNIYKGHAKKDCRSIMNVTYAFKNESVSGKFFEGAAKHHLDALEGHRSVGGVRASIYNAMPIEGVETLAQYMTDFAAANG